MSNAQRRRAERQRGKTFPGPMTEARVAQHRATTARLADLERLKRVTQAYLAAAQEAEREESEHGGDE